MPKQATTLHMAAAGGHANIVKILLENGANAEDENAVNRMKNRIAQFKFQHGMTALHLGAKNGYVSILEAFDKNLWRRCSRKVTPKKNSDNISLCGSEIAEINSIERVEAETLVTFWVFSSRVDFGLFEAK